MRVLLATLALALSGCMSAETVTIPRVPQWRATVGTFTAQEVRAECAKQAPYAVVDTSDATFTAVSHEWLQEAVTWTWYFAKATGLAYTSESFDCDKFALGFALAANVAASRAGVKAQPLVSRIYVQQVYPFGGVPAAGAHALNAVLTDRGLYVIEPQSRRTVPLADYPNRATVVRIKIGG